LLLTRQQFWRFSWISPVSYWEVTTTVRARGGELAVRSVERLMSSMEIVIEPVSVVRTRQAVLAAGRYGKGQPARLNMGDCFAYALAKSTGAALLYKGDDFAGTDIPSAM
jgi:ribonuclease VapC